MDHGGLCGRELDMIHGKTPVPKCKLNLHKQFNWIIVSRWCSKLCTLRYFHAEIWIYFYFICHRRAKTKKQKLKEYIYKNKKCDKNLLRLPCFSFFIQWWAIEFVYHYCTTFPVLRDFHKRAIQNGGLYNILGSNGRYQFQSFSTTSSC